jgi:hypothetical protein
MFTHTCSSCERRQLIFGSQVTAVTSASTERGTGIAYSFICWCGAPQTAVEITEPVVTERRESVRAA